VHLLVNFNLGAEKIREWPTSDTFEDHKSLVGVGMVALLAKLLTALLQSGAMGVFSYSLACATTGKSKGFLGRDADAYLLALHGRPVVSVIHE
jgi:hypothetical protein